MLTYGCEHTIDISVFGDTDVLYYSNRASFLHFSPLFGEWIANIYLHYVLDEWFEETVRTYCTGHAYLCRYADDFVCAFQHDKDAQRFYKALIQRLARFGLEVAEDKTQVIEFSHCKALAKTCLLYTSDAADEEDSVDLGGRRIIKKKKKKKTKK